MKARSELIKKSFADVMNTVQVQSELVDMKTYDVNNLSFHPVEKKKSKKTGLDYYAIGMRSSLSTKDFKFKHEANTFGIYNNNSVRTILIDNFKKPTPDELQFIKQINHIEKRCKEHLISIKDDIGLPLLTMEFLDEFNACRIIRLDDKSSPMMSGFIYPDTPIYDRTAKLQNRSDVSTRRGVTYRSKTIFLIQGICVHPDRIDIGVNILEAEMTRTKQKSYLY